MTTPDHDRMAHLRAETLDRIERSERWTKIFFVTAGVTEGIFLVLYVVFADFGERVHLLVFLAALLIYLTLAWAILALGAYVRTCTQRVLRAIELLAPE